MTDYAISKKSKRSLWIPILVFITLAACASAGYSYWHSHQVAADDKAQQRVVPSPVFYALDTFTVNLGDADRVLYIGINLIAEIKTTLSTPLVAGQPKQDVTDVLYTAFILR